MVGPGGSPSSRTGKAGECHTRPPCCGVLSAVKRCNGAGQFIQAAIFHGSAIEGHACDAAGIGANQHGSAAAYGLRQRPGEGCGVQG
jgi:hypothetical protein